MSITYFVMKNKVPCCLINVVIHYNKINAAKTVHMEIVMSLYFTVTKSYWYIIFIKKQTALYILLK